MVAAKLAATGLAGLVTGALASTLALAVALPWLAAEDVPFSLVSDELVLVAGGTLVATALYGVAVRVGALVRNQLAAVAISLGWMLVAENLLITLLPEVGRWLPLGAAAALVRAAPPEGGLLPMWGGGLLLAAYGLAFALAGTRFVLRRDVARGRVVRDQQRPLPD